MVERVTFQYRSGEPAKRIRAFKIFKLEESSGSSSWVEMKDLGGDAFVLGLNSSF